MLLYMNKVNLEFNFPIRENRNPPPPANAKPRVAFQPKKRLINSIKQFRKLQ